MLVLCVCVSLLKSGVLFVFLHYSCVQQALKYWKKCIYADSILRSKHDHLSLAEPVQSNGKKSTHSRISEKQWDGIVSFFSGTCFHSSLSSFYIQVTSESALNATNKQPIFYCLFVYRSTASAVVVVFVVAVCDASFWVQLIIVINNKRTAKNKHSKSKARDDRVGDLLNAIHELISTQCTNKTPTKSIIKMYLKRSTMKNHRSCGELAFVAKLAYNDRLLDFFFWILFECWNIFRL